MPRAYITAAQIETAHARVSGGESQTAVARDLGINRHALGYHLRGGKARQAGGAPWRIHVVDARRAIAVGNHALAAYHFTAAAQVLINLK